MVRGNVSMAWHARDEAFKGYERRKREREEQQSSSRDAVRAAFCRDGDGSCAPCRPTMLAGELSNGRDGLHRPFKTSISLTPYSVQL